MIPPHAIVVTHFETGRKEWLCEHGIGHPVVPESAPTWAIPSPHGCCWMRCCEPNEGPD